MEAPYDGEAILRQAEKITCPELPGPRSPECQNKRGPSMKAFQRTTVIQCSMTEGHRDCVLCHTNRQENPSNPTISKNRPSPNNETASGKNRCVFMGCQATKANSATAQRTQPEFLLTRHPRKTISSPIAGSRIAIRAIRNRSASISGASPINPDPNPIAEAAVRKTRAIEAASAHSWRLGHRRNPALTRRAAVKRISHTLFIAVSKRWAQWRQTISGKPAKKNPGSAGFRGLF